MIDGGHAEGMDDKELETFTKSRFAVPEHALVASSTAADGQLVILQPAHPPNDWAPSGGDSGGGGGDGD